jgi:hypothetical protein
MRIGLDAPTRPPRTHGGPRNGLRVGITLGPRDSHAGPWRKSIDQGAMFLCLALRQADNVQSAFLVNATDVAPDHGLPWDTRWQPVFSFDEVRDRLDVLIELGGQLDAQRTEYLKRRGTRLVSYCCGPEYVSAMQAVQFERRLRGRDLFVNQRYDAVWIIPQVAENSRGFVEVLRHRRAKVVPFVWDPVLLERRCAGLRAGGLYRPRQGPARLSVMESNLDVLNFCLYPLLIAEQAYRCRPDALRFLHVTNCERFASTNEDFIAIMSYLDLVRDGKTAFVGRHDTPEFLAEMTDAVISHQWSNPLNEFYLEVCWQGYPLIHNATMCHDLGYYYPGNDVERGAQVLLEALVAHDRAWELYRERQRRAIARYLPRSPAVVRAYADLLDELMLCPLH